MSVVNRKTPVSNPGTVTISTGGTSATSARSTQRFSGSRAASTSAAGPTVRKLTSAPAAGGTTLGAMPPSSRVTV